MPQIYPAGVSSNQGVTINATYPLTGGGPVGLGQSLTLGLSTSQNTQRAQHSVSPSPDGTNLNFTIEGASGGLSLAYVDIYVDGFLYDPADYTVSGNQLFFASAPAAGTSVYVVFASPVDLRTYNRLLPATDGTTTTFTFPSAQPNGTYIDLFLDGKFLHYDIDFFLNIVNGVPVVVMATAPTAGKVLAAVFDPSTNASRSEYSVYPPSDGTRTSFFLNGGPSTPYIDVYRNGKFCGLGVDYTFSFLSGKWMLEFTAAPSVGDVILAVFAPGSIISSEDTSSLVIETNGTRNVSQTVLNLVAGPHITLTPDGSGDVTISTSGLPTLVGSGTTPAFAPSAPGTVATQTCTVAGAATGMRVFCGPLADPGIGASFTAFVSSPNTVTVYYASLGSFTTNSIPVGVAVYS